MDLSEFLDALVEAVEPSSEVGVDAMPCLRDCGGWQVTGIGDFGNGDLGHFDTEEQAQAFVAGFACGMDLIQHIVARGGSTVVTVRHPWECL